jgi:hypothetical protein
MLFDNPAFDFSNDSLVKDSLAKSLFSRERETSGRTSVKLDNLLREERGGPARVNRGAEPSRSTERDLGRDR